MPEAKPTEKCSNSPQFLRLSVLVSTISPSRFPFLNPPPHSLSAPSLAMLGGPAPDGVPWGSDPKPLVSSYCAQKAGRMGSWGELNSCYLLEGLVTLVLVVIKARANRSIARSRPTPTPYSKDSKLICHLIYHDQALTPRLDSMTSSPGCIRNSPYPHAL